MAMMKVEFTDVGRDKRCWSDDYKVGSDFEKFALSQIRKHGALMSREVWFQPYEPEEGKPERIAIMAGMRNVGTLTIQPLDSPATPR